MNSVKYIISVVAGALLAYFKLYGLAFGLVAAVVILDLITGVIAAVVTGEGLSSQKAFKGVLKKATLFLALIFGTFLDLFVPYAVKHVNISLPEGLLFSSVICVYIVVTECISIIENIFRCHDGALPKWLEKLFAGAKDKLDKGGDDNDESAGNG